ncbi:MAG: universal stress protein [Bdellovibrionales bacterium]|nr:universal stress protein [Bdellovibrionales bacterium]
MAKTLPLLVTTDLQQDSASLRRTRAVNQYAVALGEKLKTTLEVLHVANLGEIAQIPQAASAILNTQKSQLKNLVNPFQNVSRARFIVGHPATSISKLASQKTKYELLVQGTSGRTGLSRAFLGSVAEEVIRHSKIPVMTVGPEAQKHALHADFLSKGAPLILVATDLKKTSLPALQYALGLAKRLGGRVHAVYHLQTGLHPLLQTAMATPSSSRELQELVRTLERDAEKTLKKTQAKFQKAGVEFSWSVLEKGPTAPEPLIAEAKKCGASLMVMGTHARGLLLGSFLGSTCRGVVLGSPVPVITVQR